VVSVEIVKRYPGFTLDVSWRAEKSVVGLFGPSGAGKTLTLQCLAGLIRPDAGRIVVDDRVFFDAAASIDLRPSSGGSATSFRATRSSRTSPSRRMSPSGCATVPAPSASAEAPK